MTPACHASCCLQCSPVFGEISECQVVEYAVFVITVTSYIERSTQAATDNVCLLVHAESVCMCSEVFALF